MASRDGSITSALEQLAIALGESQAIPLPEVIRALERAAERLRGDNSVSTNLPVDLVTQSAAARAVGVSRQAVHQWVQKGMVATHRSGDHARHSPMVSLAEVVIVANRTTEGPFSNRLQEQLTQFLGSIEHVLGPHLMEAMLLAINEPGPDVQTRHAVPVLREFVIAAMGTTSKQQEFSEEGVVMLADLAPLIPVDPKSRFGRACTDLDLLFQTSGGAGFDSASTSILALLGCASVGATLPGATGEVGTELKASAESVWGETWARRLLDLSFYVDEESSPPLTRCTAAISYLCTNRVLRRAQSSGVSINYARTAGLILPDRHFGMPGYTALMQQSDKDAAAWWSSEECAKVTESSLQRSEVNPFRPFVFTDGLLDPSIHGVRHYCYSTQDTRTALLNMLDTLQSVNKERYLELTIQTLTRALLQNSLELSSVDDPRDFDWWKDHLVRTTPREIMLGLRDPKARKVAHALLVQTTSLPDVIQAADSDSSLRNRLRIYVKNLEFDIVSERYHDDQRRGTTRTIKAVTETFTLESARRLAEVEVERLLN